MIRTSICILPLEHTLLLFKVKSYQLGQQPVVMAAERCGDVFIWIMNNRTFQGQVSTPEGEPTAMLKSRIKVKRAEISKPLYSKQEPKLVKEAVEVFAEIGESVSHGVETSIDGGGESAMETDESSLPLKLRSKKKGLPEKLSTEKVISTPVPLSGVASTHKEPPKREPPVCPHTTHDLSSASAKVSTGSTLGKVKLNVATLCFMNGGVCKCIYYHLVFVGWRDHPDLGDGVVELYTGKDYPLPLSKGSAMVHV